MKYDTIAYVANMLKDSIEAQNAAKLYLEECLETARFLEDSAEVNRIEPELEIVSSKLKREINVLADFINHDF